MAANSYWLPFLFVIMLREDELFTTVSDSFRMVSSGVDFESASFFSIRNSKSGNDKRYSTPSIVNDKIIYDFMKADRYIVIPRWCISDLRALGAKDNGKENLSDTIYDMVNQIIKRRE